MKIRSTEEKETVMKHTDPIYEIVRQFCQTW